MSNDDIHSTASVRVPPLGRGVRTADPQLAQPGVPGLQARWRGREDGECGTSGGSRLAGSLMSCQYTICIGNFGCRYHM